MGSCNCSVPGKGSDSVWFSICFPALHQPHSTKEGGKTARLLTWLPSLWGAFIQHQAATYPLVQEERWGGRWPSLWCSHPICHPVQWEKWDTGSSGEQSSLRAVTGLSETSLLSSGVPKNQTQGSYTSMRESKLWSWLFSFIVCVGDAIWLICSE